MAPCISRSSDSHNVECVKKVAPCFQWGKISTTFAISALWNDVFLWKNKYIFMFSEKNIYMMNVQLNWQETKLFGGSNRINFRYLSYFLLQSSNHILLDCSLDSSTITYMESKLSSDFIDIYSSQKAETLFLIARFTGPTWGPPGSCQPQMGPMSASWTLLSGTCFIKLRFPWTMKGVFSISRRAFIHKNVNNVHKFYRKCFCVKLGELRMQFHIISDIGH